MDYSIAHGFVSNFLEDQPQWKRIVGSQPDFWTDGTYVIELREEEKGLIYFYLLRPEAEDYIIFKFLMTGSFALFYSHVASCGYEWAIG